MIPAPTETDLRRNIKEDFVICEQAKIRRLTFEKVPLPGTKIIEIAQSYIRLFVAERKENNLLRAALATSKDPCLYCQLPADEMAKCKSGFPGCARMDDLSGCPEFGAMLELYELKKQLTERK